MIGTHSKDGKIIPINITTPAIIEAANHTYSITSTKTDITLDANCTNFLIVPAAIPTTPMFVKLTFGWTAATAATTTSFDFVITEAYPAIQMKVENSCAFLSIIAASGTQALYVMQYAG